MNSDKGQIKSILLIRLGGLGDVVFTLPAVNAVKRAFPDARITYLVYKEFASLLTCFPRVDEVVELDRALYRGLHPVTLLTGLLSLLRKLSPGRFDLTIDFQGFGETGWMSWWTRAPKRWGLVYRASRRWAYTHAIRRNDSLHPIEFQLDLLEKAGGISITPLQNRLTVPTKTLEEARQLFAKWNLDLNSPTLFIQPFSKVDHKNWPLDNYLTIACELRDKGVQVIFGGGPSEQEVLKPIRQAGFAVAAGNPLVVSAALVDLSTVILGSDTGLLHVGLALGKRVVMIINSTNPGKCFPFGHPDWTVVPENRLHISSVKPQQVLQACVQTLANAIPESAGLPGAVAKAAC